MQNSKKSLMEFHSASENKTEQAVQSQGCANKDTLINAIGKEN